MSEGPVVAANDLVFDFGPVRALDGVSFAVHPGEIFGLLGHNGAGKTTLIRLVNGLLRPSSGSVRTFGSDPMVDGQLVRARTGVLTEYPALDVFLTPMENLIVYGQVHGLDRAEAAQRAAQLLQRLGVTTDKATSPARNLSAGLKQRVALARALVHAPELLLLDEPTSNLDPLAARGVRDLALELARERGRTIVLSTHNLAEAQQLCDRVAIIRNGSILAVGSLGELSQRLVTGLVHVETSGPDDTDDAAEVFASIPFNAAPSTNGTTVSARIDQTRIPALVQRLVAAGVPVQSVRPETPTLEDVYLSLHRQDAAVGVSP